MPVTAEDILWLAGFLFIFGNAMTNLGVCDIYPSVALLSSIRKVDRCSSTLARPYVRIVQIEQNICISWLFKALSVSHRFPDVIAKYERVKNKWDSSRDIARRELRYMETLYTGIYMSSPYVI